MKLEDLLYKAGDVNVYVRSAQQHSSSRNSIRFSACNSRKTYVWFSTVDQLPVAGLQLIREANQIGPSKASPSILPLP